MDFREKVVEAGGDVPQRTPGCNIACSVVAHKMVGSEPSESESASERLAAREHQKRCIYGSPQLQQHHGKGVITARIFVFFFRPFPVLLLPNGSSAAVRLLLLSCVMQRKSASLLHTLLRSGNGWAEQQQQR